MPFRTAGELSMNNAQLIQLGFAIYDFRKKKGWYGREFVAAYECVAADLAATGALPEAHGKPVRLLVSRLSLLEGWRLGPVRDAAGRGRGGRPRGLSAAGHSAAEELQPPDRRPLRVSAVELRVLAALLGTTEAVLWGGAATSPTARAMPTADSQGRWRLNQLVLELHGRHRDTLHWSEHLISMYLPPDLARLHFARHYPGDAGAAADWADMTDAVRQEMGALMRRGASDAVHIVRRTALDALARGVGPHSTLADPAERHGVLDALAHFARDPWVPRLVILDDTRGGPGYDITQRLRRLGTLVVAFDRDAALTMSSSGAALEPDFEAAAGPRAVLDRAYALADWKTRDDVAAEFARLARRVRRPD